MLEFFEGVVVGTILATVGWIYWAIKAMDPRDGRPQPTHKVSFYGVRCYMNDLTGEMWGVNWLYHKLILPVTAMHNTLAYLVPGFGSEGFPLRILEDYHRSETSQ